MPACLYACLALFGQVLLNFHEKAKAPAGRFCHFSGSPTANCALACPCFKFDR
jgi:hypothetical protein